MSSRGRRAVLPPVGFHVDPPLAREGLVVTVINSAGFGKDFDFSRLPGLAEPMQRSLAVLFADRSRRWTSHASAQVFWKGLLAFARFLAELDHQPRDVDELTVAVLKRWRQRHVGTTSGRIAMQTLRTLLQADPRMKSGSVADELARRVPQHPGGRVHSMEDPDRERVILVARQQFRAARLRIEENARFLEQWRAGQLLEKSREWRIGEILDFLARTGDVPRTVLPRGERSVKNYTLLGGRSAERTWGRLYLTRPELTALAVLLTDQFGWNLSVYDRMPAPTRLPSAGEAATVTYQVQVEKHRRGGGRWFSTENVTDSGADSPGRLITHALQATFFGRDLAARLAPGTDLLMTGRASALGLKPPEDLDRPRPLGPLIFGVSTDDAGYWGQQHQLGGSPFQRIRRTTVVREGQPLQHAPGTHHSVYVLPDQRVQRESQPVFADGVWEAVEQAQAVVFAGQLATAPEPEHVETATAECADESTSRWPAEDGSCATDFLLCLACPNAHVHPGHYPRLAHLHQQLAALRSALPEPDWRRRWQAHWLRLEDLRSRIGESAFTRALAHITETDRVVVGLLLRGELAR